MELKALMVRIPCKKTPVIQETQGLEESSDTSKAISSIECQTINDICLASIVNLLPSISHEHSAKHSSTKPQAKPEVEPLTLATSSEAGVEDQVVPTTLNQISTHRFSPDSSYQAARIIGLCSVKMGRYGRPIEPEEKQVVFNILKSFASFDTFTREINDRLNMRNILSNILGEAAIPTAHPYEYPEPLQRNATIILERLDKDIAAEAALEEPSMSPAPPDSTAPHAAKRRRVQQASTPSIVSNDPTIKHIMRGIERSGEARLSLRLQPSHPTRDHRVFGDNGLQVGQWWPYRVCALRDGAHGHMQGGISGSMNVGAYSIVVSNDYADLDHDHGQTLYYSGSNSQSNKDPSAPLITTATKSLRLSHTHRLPIRVLRSGLAISRYAPRKGFRYDGLYTIQAEMTAKNARGGAYLRFRLERNDGQREIDTNRPSRKEVEYYDLLKEGVGW